MSDDLRFSFHDTIAGYVKSYEPESDSFELATVDERRVTVFLTDETFAEQLRNLGENYQDVTAELRQTLVPERLIFVQGLFYPTAKGHDFEAKHLVLLGPTSDVFKFEDDDYWTDHLRELADFYLTAEFGGDPDFHRYRTSLDVDGNKNVDGRQETATMSRLVYGFATAYLFTGEERFLRAAEAGSAFLIEHMRVRTGDGDEQFFIHARLVNGSVRKILASESSDDDDTIPLYEQIYALAGLTQTYRATRSPEIRKAIDETMAFMQNHYWDDQDEGFFSHVDPLTLDAHADELGPNRARKNWNSIGDHAPAYLINLYLATGDERFADLLEQLASIVVRRFPDFGKSPFVVERFHENWEPDLAWGWQQNRTVVGHNLKIAWNLTRIYHIRPDDSFRDLAGRIAETMPSLGRDVQRGGWYDALERSRHDGRECHRFVWHDRKAWWQQEQAILAYLILAGSLDNADYLKIARESIAFYTTWFPDHDAGGVYFTVMAGGSPYLQQGERTKGNHAMSGYHAFELASLSAVYTKLLLTGQPLELHFKPWREECKDGVLRVAPDLLPADRVAIESVWVDDEPLTDFDSDSMTVRLPASSGSRPSVRVRLIPAGADPLALESDRAGETVTLRLIGRLDDADVPRLRAWLPEAVADATTVRVDAAQLRQLCPAGARALLTSAGRDLPKSPIRIRIDHAREQVSTSLRMADPDGEGIDMGDEVRVEE